MSALRHLLQDFHGAILDNDASRIVPRLKGGRLAPGEQMAIYLQGYRLRLTGAIRSDYPELLAWMGDEAFDALAMRYVEAHPPTEASLDVYPFGFADFVRGAVGGGFAADLAALEGAIARVFFLPDSEALTPQALATLTPEQFGTMPLRLRKASALLACDTPVDAYMAACRQGMRPATPEPDASYVMVVRHENEVRRHALHATGFCLLRALAEGQSMGQALESAGTGEAAAAILSTHLQPWFAAWTAAGFFQSL